MLYYYNIKKKRRWRSKKWFFAAILSIGVWAYFYIGSFANVANDMFPGLQNQILPGFHTNIDPANSSVKPKVLKSGAAIDSMTLDKMQKAKLDFEKEGRLREANELAFCLELLAKMKDEKQSPASKKREKVITKDIINTINYFRAGNTASRTAQILGNYDEGDLAYVYYPNYGVHFNPVTTANMAIDKYEKREYKDVVKIADALLDNAILGQYPEVGPYYLWENYFDLEFGPYKFSAPWHSGMAQGLILDVVGKAYEITGNRKYLKEGDLILNSFKISWKDGGVTQTDEYGNWYLEIAATDKIKILNGFLFTLTGMNSYYETTKSLKVKKLFDSGVNEVAAHVQEYDLGYWSNYSVLPGNKANYGYHKIHVDLLKRLYDASKNKKIEQYTNKFDFYLNNRFIDVPPTHPSFASISFLTERGIIRNTDGWFSAKNDISRADFIRWLALSNKWKPATVYKGRYRDIWRDNENWPYVESAYEHGLNLADRNGNLRPSDPLTRAEVAWILCKVFKLDIEQAEEIEPVAAKDIVGNPFEKQIRIAVYNKFIDLFEPNYFRPDININREQAANIIYRIISNTGHDAGSEESSPGRAEAKSEQNQ